MNENWRPDALCKEYPEIDWCPERGTSQVAAKAICNRCLVREECLEEALSYPREVGVRGGTSEKQRRAIRRARSLYGSEEVII